jgi:hypothetical protein
MENESKFRLVVEKTGDNAEGGAELATVQELADKLKIAINKEDWEMAEILNERLQLRLATIRVDRAA